MTTKERAGGERPLIALLTRPARRIGAKIASLRRGVRRSAGARELAQLDERLLRDIGLTRFEARAAACGLVRLPEPAPVDRPSGAEILPLQRRAIALRVDQATSAPPLKRAACE